MKAVRVFTNVLSLNTQKLRFATNQEVEQCRGEDRAGVRPMQTQSKWMTRSSFGKANQIE